jgi:Transposase IS116/IS110/IS902 family
VAFFRAQRYTPPQRLDALYEQVHRTAPGADPVVVRAARWRVAALLDHITAVRDHQDRYEKAMTALLNHLPEATPVATLPGIDTRLVPELVAALGPNTLVHPQRFQAASDLAQLAGCAPITKAWGKRRTVRLRRACDTQWRRTFYGWAWASLTRSRWAHAYYDYRKAHHHDHATILRGLGQKWAKILYTLWSSGQAYDEAQHIAQLKRHKVVWAMSL